MHCIVPYICVHAAITALRSVLVEQYADEASGVGTGDERQGLVLPRNMGQRLYSQTERRLRNHKDNSNRIPISRQKKKRKRGKGGKGARKDKATTSSPVFPPSLQQPEAGVGGTRPPARQQHGWKNKRSEAEFAALPQFSRPTPAPLWLGTRMRVIF